MTQTAQTRAAEERNWDLILELSPGRPGSTAEVSSRLAHLVAPHVAEPIARPAAPMPRPSMLDVFSTAVGKLVPSSFSST